MSRTASILLLSASVMLGRARADSQIDGVEHFFGATNIHAVSGHGRLTIGVSQDGDLTVLAWPTPSYLDQLAYISSNAWEARAEPRFGALEGAGSFLGLLIEDASGRRVVWLRDRALFTIAQDYGAMDGPNVETRFVSASLGLSVTVTDAIDPERDVLVRHVRVERGAASAVTSAWLVTYANLSPLPSNSRVPELPVTDWAFDGRDDYAALWDASAGAIVHFHPEDERVLTSIASLLGGGAIDWGPIGAQLVTGTPSEGELASLASNLDTAYGAGAYLALTTSPAPDQHQVGFDATPFCDSVDDLVDNVLALATRFPDQPLPIDPGVLESLRCDRTAPSFRDAEGWTHVAEDALADVADGELSGSGIASGEVNEALRTPLVFDGAGVAEASVVLAAASSAAGATALLTEVGDPAAVPGRAQSALDSFLAGVRLPAGGSELVRRVARRALINIRVGTVRDNGAIVASIARQAPYGLDWPRDGMFFNNLLNVSGQSALAETRTALYASWQRTEEVTPTLLVDPDPPRNPDGSRRRTYPAGVWEMNYFPDGMPGGVFRFEIDNAAFALFCMVAQAGWVEESRRQEYLRSRWVEIERAADLLAEWRDPESGLHAPAQEDDNGPYTQTLHGAITVFGALDIASRGARLLGEDERAAAWEARAGELREAILTELYDEEAMRFISVPAAAINPGSAPTGPTAWLVWPMRLLPWDDARVDTQLRADLETIRPAVDLETEGGAYFLKNLLSLALARGNDAELRPRIEAMLETIASHATQGTLHFGEVTITLDEGGTRRADQRVSTPHLWEGALFYMTAMALEDPDALLAYDRALPASRVPEPFVTEPPMTTGGCCAIAGRSPSSPLGVAALLWLVVRRRR